MSLSFQQIISAREKTFQNSKDLIMESELLFNNNSFARSLFLSQIAVEEMGKYLMVCSIMAQHIRKEKIDWKKFWKRFRNHIEKRGNIYQLGVLLSVDKNVNDISEELKKMADNLRELESEKLASLYTDFESNKFIVPSETVEKKLAEKRLNQAKSVINFFEHGENYFKSKDLKNIDLPSNEDFISGLQSLFSEK